MILLRKLPDGGIQYPYSEFDVRRDFGKRHLIPDDVSVEDLAVLAVWRVEEIEAPVVSAGQVVENLPGADGVEEYEPGKWQQKWIERAATLEELATAKADKQAAISAKRDEVMASGFVPAIGPVAGHRLQTRNLDDRTNWLTSQAAYSAAVAGGHGDVSGAEFRTVDNETIPATYADGLSTLLAMAAWGKAIMGHSWTLKDAVTAAETFADLAAIDIEAGWPE